MKTTTKIKAGALANNHSSKLVRVKSAVKAGGLSTNHSQKLVRG